MWWRHVENFMAFSITLEMMSTCVKLHGSRELYVLRLRGDYHKWVCLPYSKWNRVSSIVLGVGHECTIKEGSISSSLVQKCSVHMRYKWVVANVNLLCNNIIFNHHDFLENMPGISSCHVSSPLFVEGLGLRKTYFQSMFDPRSNIKDLELLYQNQDVINNTQHVWSIFTTPPPPPFPLHCCHKSPM